MADKKIRMSQKGYDDLVERLEFLKNVRRKEVQEKLKEARSQGDLSENAEYDAAKDEQGLLEAEINETEYKIKNAEIVSEQDLSSDEVGIYSYVRLYDMEYEEELILKIVSSIEANAEIGEISEDSPIGMAALKHKVGDVIEVEVPDGTIKMEIREISKEKIDK